MVEAVGAFFAAWLLSWPVLVLLVLLGAIFESNGARGWSVFTGLVVAAVSYFYFHVSFFTILLITGLYLVIGVAWSFYRYKRHVSEVVEENRNADVKTKQRVLLEIHPKAMLVPITRWILIWPFSLIENFVGDFIVLVQQLVTKVFKGIYHRIYDLAVAELTR